MSRNNSISVPIQMTEAEEAQLKKIGSNTFDLDMVHEDLDHPIHKQDWTTVTKPEESWANKEIRRKSMWSNQDENNPHFVPETLTERRGSILSVWKAGKDKNGRSILSQDGGARDDSSEEIVERDASPQALSPKMLARERRLSDRRGSILSIWSNGKDEEGRDIMVHDDEEWKV